MTNTAAPLPTGTPVLVSFGPSPWTDVITGTYTVYSGGEIRYYNVAAMQMGIRADEITAL